MPGDKFISHCAAILGSLSQGCSKLNNFSTDSNCQATVEALRAMGIFIHRNSSTLIIGRGGLYELKAPGQVLDVRSSETTMCLLAGVLPGQPFASTMKRDASGCSQALSNLAEPLRLMGATVDVAPDRIGPIRIRGMRPLDAIDYQPALASTAIKAAVLVAALVANGCTSI